MKQQVKSVAALSFRIFSHEEHMSFLIDGHSVPYQYPAQLIGERAVLVAIVQTSENGQQCFLCPNLDAMTEVWGDYQGFVTWVAVHWAQAVFV